MVRYEHDAGRAYVYYGSAGGLGISAGWTSFGGSANEKMGSALGTMGDADGDGYADIVVGAYGYNSMAGKADIYHGSASGLPGSPTWTAYGESAGDQFGDTVGAAGDVNGDGYTDLIAGAWGFNTPGAADAGRAYVYHGSAAMWPTALAGTLPAKARATSLPAPWLWRGTSTATATPTSSSAHRAKTGIKVQRTSISVRQTD